MVDKEHEEWLQEEKERKQLRTSHWETIKKKFSDFQERKQTEAETNEMQEEEDDAADDAADEMAEQERDDGLQAGMEA